LEAMSYLDKLVFEYALLIILEIYFRMLLRSPP